jgi:hypothetical protein
MQSGTSTIFSHSSWVSFNPSVVATSGDYTASDQAYVEVHDPNQCDPNLDPWCMGTGGSEIIDIPSDFHLVGSYPNPFNPSTSIRFGLPEASDVVLAVVDMLGREVYSTSAAELPAGFHSLTVDASHWASGVYAYKLEVRSESGELRRLGGTMTLMK